MGKWKYVDEETGEELCLVCDRKKSQCVGHSAYGPSNEDLEDDGDNDSSGSSSSSYDYDDDDGGYCAGCGNTNSCTCGDEHSYPKGHVPGGGSHGWGVGGR